ncbi:MAG: pirin family protein, partial [Bdellovibrionales bacterium]|nr:pirin family protein [Bdellovibrionales bacterium]
RFHSLRVINEDIIAAGAGVGMHGHQDMEILTFVLDGALEHRDSMNNHEIIHPYCLQKMSAGTGVMHSEFNHYKDKATHLFQIWIMPDELGIKPSYETLDIRNIKDAENGVLVASPNKEDKVIHLYQNTCIYYYKSASNATLPKQNLWIQMLKGSITSSKGFTLTAGDAIGIDANENEGIQVSGDAEFLVFVFPSNQ